MDGAPPPRTPIPPNTVRICVSALSEGRLIHVSIGLIESPRVPALWCILLDEYIIPFTPSCIIHHVSIYGAGVCSWCFS